MERSWGGIFNNCRLLRANAPLLDYYGPAAIKYLAVQCEITYENRSVNGTKKLP